MVAWTRLIVIRTFIVLFKVTETELLNKTNIPIRIIYFPKICDSEHTSIIFSKGLWQWTHQYYIFQKFVTVNTPVLYFPKVCDSEHTSIIFFLSFEMHFLYTMFVCLWYWHNFSIYVSITVKSVGSWEHGPSERRLGGGSFMVLGRWAMCNVLQV